METRQSLLTISFGMLAQAQLMLILLDPTACLLARRPLLLMDLMLGPRTSLRLELETFMDGDLSLMMLLSMPMTSHHSQQS